MPDASQRTAAVLAVLAGGSVAAVAAEHGVGVAEVEAWRARFLAAGTGALAGADTASPGWDALFAVLEHAPVPCQVFGPDGLTLFLNPAQAAFLGIPDRSTPVGAFNVLTDPFSKAAGAVPFFERAYAGAAVAVPERSVRLEDDRWDLRARTAWYEQLLVPVLSGGRVALVLSFITDTTERHIARELDGQAEKQESLSLLAGGVAHDLNNVLTLIQFSCDFAREPATIVDPPAVARHLAEVERAVGVAAELCGQLQLVARTDSVQRGPVDLAQLVDEAAPLLRSGVGRTIALDVSCEGQGHRVWGVRTHLYQLLLNLVVNAQQATGDGGRISVRTEHVQLPEAVQVQGPRDGSLPAGGYLVLRVRDTGVGMSLDVARRVFDPYFTTKAEGSGLGLATVIGVVRDHDGGLQLRSAPGEGTEFRVLLPESTRPPATATG